MYANPKEPAVKGAVCMNCSLPLEVIETRDGEIHRKAIAYYCTNENCKKSGLLTLQIKTNSELAEKAEAEKE